MDRGNINEAGFNEAETCAELIDPALKTEGWGVVEDSRVRRVVITHGHLIGGGKRRRRGQVLFRGLMALECWHGETFKD